MTASGDSKRRLVERSDSSSEGIDGFVLRRAADVRSQSVAVYDVDAAVQETGDVTFEAYTIINGHIGVGVDLDHHVGVAISAMVTARSRAKDTNACSPPRSMMSCVRST